MSGFARLTALLGLLLASGAAAAQTGGTCRIGEEQRARLLALPYEAFDQQAGSGWRGLYEAGCIEAAAEIVEAYMEAHPALVLTKPPLPFHAGQLRAFLGEYEAAAAHMRKAIFPNPETHQVRARQWNDYVRANIAFLERDEAALRAIYEEMGGGEAEPAAPFAPPAQRQPEPLNFDIVAGLLACFDKPYAQAYACRPE